MTREQTNYWAEAVSDSWDTVENFVDEMVEQWRESGEVSSDLHNDYSDGDSYHHESHVDRFYSLTEAAQILDQLSEYEETDNGLWEGLNPKSAVSTQAAYTYGNAVLAAWNYRIEELNEALEELTESLAEALTEADSEATEDDADAARESAGEKLIRVYALLGDRKGRDGDRRAMEKASWDGVCAGDYTAALALADWYADNDLDRTAEELRRILK